MKLNEDILLKETKLQCQCGSLNIVSVLAKCNDMFSCSTQDSKEHDGYVDNNILNIGQGDYIDFSVCLDCNKIQHDVRPQVEKGKVIR